MKNKVSLSTRILTVLLLFVSVVLWNFPVAAASANSHIGNINTFNKQRAAHFANEMRIKLTKMVNNKISPAYSDFYEEEFDHYEHNSAYVKPDGFLIAYTSGPIIHGGQISLSITHIQSLTGAISVNGQITEGLKNQILISIESSIGIEAVFQRSYQTNVNYYYSYTFSQEDENKYKSGNTYGTAYLRAWFPAVSANGIAVYKYWAIGPGGVVSGYRYAPCGAFVPEKHAPQAINFTLSFVKAK